jgi:uncharacterized protein YjdB
MRIRKSKQIWFVMLGVFVAVFLFTFLTQKFGNKNDVDAASLANFDAGYIISDYQMGDYNSMSEADIQAFLTSKNSCSNTNYNYYVALSRNTNYWWHWANGHFVCLSEERFGDGETIGSGDSAAHIIWQAAQDFKINPKVLIVLLQKETGLITDPIPNNGDYRKATGYGCPDTAACLSSYYGFKNQVRNAASLFRTVLNGGWTNYPLGNNYIQYNPNAACGGSWVNIRSRATSALYRYTPYQPNAGALAAGYGATGSCGAYGNRNFYLYFQDWFGGITDEGRPALSTILNNNRVASTGSDVKLSYRTHLEYYGWLDWVEDGAMSGSAGYAIQTEALQLKLGSNVDGGITYQAHVAEKGWLDWVSNGETAGTTGQSLQTEAVRIKLTGEVARRYNVYYRVQVAEKGWLDWVSNGETAGTTGQSLQVEAIQIKITKKESNSGPVYHAHVANDGWQGWVKNSALAGTTGQSKQMEAAEIKLPDELSSMGNIVYRAHVAVIGWQDWIENGALAGTTGQAKQMEAIEIKLTGELANKYDVYYRAHVANIGWQDWVKNGALAGTTGQAKQMEALEVELVAK